MIRPTASASKAHLLPFPRHPIHFVLLENSHANFLFLVCLCVFAYTDHSFQSLCLGVASCAAKVTGTASLGGTLAEASWQGRPERQAIGSGPGLSQDSKQKLILIYFLHT